MAVTFDSDNATLPLITTNSALNYSRLLELLMLQNEYIRVLKQDLDKVNEELTSLDSRLTALE